MRHGAATAASRVMGVEGKVSRAAGRLLLATAALALGGASTRAAGQQPDIVGSWEWTRKKDSCAERYVYRQDGTLSIRRGEELTENTYRMAWAPEPNGRYRVTVVTVGSDGGPDCDGATGDRTGRESVVYVLFGQSRETMIQCGSPAGTDCTGLMKRTAADQRGSK